MSSQSAAARDLSLRPRLLREERSFVLYSWVTTSVAVVVLSIGLAADGHAARSFDIDVVVWIAIACVLGLAPVPSDRGPALAIDLPVLLAAGFAFGPAVGGVVAWIGAADLRELRHEISVHRSLFNRSQTCLSVMAAAMTFGLLGGTAGTWPFVILAAVAGLATDVILNYSLVAMATSLRTRTEVLRVVRDMKFGSPAAFAGSYVCLGLLALLVLEAYQRLGIGGLVASVVPLVLARQAFSSFQRLEVADRAMNAKRRAIEQLGSTIAEERRDERTRIAASLHDDVLQSLYNVSLHTHVIREDLRTGRLLELDRDLPALLEASESASDLLRGVIRDLRRSTLGRSGFVDTLNLLATHLSEQCSVPIELILDTGQASPELELVMYQVAREALTNASRYSNADRIRATLHEDDDRFVLEVEDDGIGFDVGSVDADVHFGLQLMRERVDSVGGFLTIDSSSGRGTRVLAVFRPSQGT